MLDISVHAEARRDLLHVRDYLDGEPPRRGEMFVGDFERTLELIRNFPNLGRPLDGGFRRMTILGWDYGIIFQRRGDLIYVVALAHKRQQEDFWRRRVP